jgi:hypothetical protein
MQAMFEANPTIVQPENTPSVKHESDWRTIFVSTGNLANVTSIRPKYC